MEVKIKISKYMGKYRDVPFFINVWTKYGKPRLYCNAETALNMKTIK